MKGLQGERLRQAFRYFDKDGDGYIMPEDFKRIILVDDYKVEERTTLIQYFRTLQDTRSPIVCWSVFPL
jgi:Ca2+-binding EF-hand superfamily protein